MILIELKLVRLLLNVRHLGSITLETTTTLASDMIWYQHCSHIEEEDLLWWCSGGNGTTSGHQPNPFVLLLAVPLQQHLLQLVDMDTTNRGICVGCNLKSHQKLEPSFSTVYYCVLLEEAVVVYAILVGVSYFQRLCWKCCQSDKRITKLVFWI